MLWEEGKGDGDPSMPKPQTFGGSCPSSPPFPREREAGLLQAPFFVFEAGSGFSEPFPWEHDSILYLKARIQLKLRIENNQGK